MNQTELIARVRRNAFIRDNHPNYTDQVILDELNDALRSIYEGLVTIPRMGHWLQSYTFSSTVAQARARITPRAVVGGVEKVEIGETNQAMFALDEVVEPHAQWYETFASRTGMPQYYCIRSDQIEFLPAFDRVMTVRVSYYIKPSILQAAQPGGAAAGRIQSKTATEIIMVANFTGPTGVSGQQPIDIIHPDGTCELSLVDGDPNGSGMGDLQLFWSGIPVDLSRVQVGDFVRAAGYTDWPALPEEFHRTVADAASVKIMLQLNMVAKASTIAESVGGDIGRLRELMNTPRTRRNPKRIGLSMVTFGQGRRFYPRFP